MYQLGSWWIFGDTSYLSGVLKNADKFRFRASKFLQISMIFHVIWSAKLRLSCRHEFYCLKLKLPIFLIICENFMKFHRVLFSEK